MGLERGLEGRRQRRQARREVQRQRAGHAGLPRRPEVAVVVRRGQRRHMAVEVVRARAQVDVVLGREGGAWRGAIGRVARRVGALGRAQVDVRPRPRGTALAALAAELTARRRAR